MGRVRPVPGLLPGDPSGSIITSIHRHASAQIGTSALGYATGRPGQPLNDMGAVDPGRVGGRIDR
jgi:hypothetical protein